MRPLTNKDNDKGGADHQRTIISFFHRSSGKPTQTSSTPMGNKNHSTPPSSVTRTLPPTKNNPSGSSTRAAQVATKFTIPNFRRVSTNVSGIGSTTGNKQRRERTILYIQKLLQNHDIMYIQEAHITSEGELNELAHEFPGCKLYGCLSDETPAQKGVIIILKNTVTTLYEVTQAYTSKSNTGKGRILSIALAPVGDNKANLLTFRDTCVYFKSGGGTLVNQERKLMIEELGTIPMDTDIEFLGGDMNMHTNELMDELLLKRRLEEIDQPTNTFYRMVGSRITKTRIDRWYCNISPAQTSILQPICRALTTAWGTIGRYSGGKMDELHSFPSTKHKTATHITDHLPIALYLQQPAEGGNANKKQTIPDWVLDTPFSGSILRRTGKPPKRTTRFHTTTSHNLASRLKSQLSIQLKC